MKPPAKGILLAVIQVALVLSLGLKLLIDRTRYPRVWAETIAYDPDSPIRGRYLAVRLQVDGDHVYSEPLADPSLQNRWTEHRNVKLAVENSHLVAFPSEEWTGLQIARWKQAGRTMVALEEPVDFYLPEHVPDPSRPTAGERLWVEVTIPPKGPPRPIQLGLKKDGVLTPLKLN